jgi:hypothetical protein
MPDAYTVILADPVDATFRTEMLLRDTIPVDIAAVTVPPWSSKVIDNRRVEYASSPTRQLMELSDNHTEAWQADAPCLGWPLDPAKPKSAPIRVMLIDPVEATFNRREADTVPTDVDIDCVALPNRAPTVASARSVLANPWPAVHHILVSDCHLVASKLLWPSRPEAEYCASPKREPCKVMPTDPVAQRFVRGVLLVNGTSAVIASDKVPVALLTVTMTARLADINSDGLQLIAEFDSHRLDSQLECPKAAESLYAVDENPSPTSEILVAPVVGALIQWSGGMFFIACVNWESKILISGDFIWCMRTGSRPWFTINAVICTHFSFIKSC